MKYSSLLIIIVSILFSCEKDNGDNSAKESVSMEPDYVNDIFYSLHEQTSFDAVRDNWDIGFRTFIRSPSIIINSGAGVELYEISKDTNDWYNTVDITGFDTWPILSNSLENWEVGAFSANMTGYPDYGWAIYNTVTHDLIGNAVFLIKLQDGTLKKIFIRKKHSTLNTYEFLYSNVDGTDKKHVELNCGDYIEKEYIYYSISGNETVDREPVKENWDLLFTRYYDPDAYYVVTGVLTKPGITVAEVIGIAPEAADTTTGQFSSSLSVIGWDWKEFDQNTFEYSLVEDLTYFVKTVSGEVYKLYFTGFDGSSTGEIRFTTKRIK